MARIRVWVLLTLLTAWAGVAGQESKVAFEVTSVKPGHDGPITLADVLAGVATPRVLPGGRFEANQVTGEQLLWFAYEGRIKQEYQFAGVPAWMHSDRFVISAKASADAPAAQMRLMVQSLLEDRFKMVTHMEPREMRLQALVLAQSDGTLGPRLFRESTCSPQVVRELVRKFPEKYRSPPDIPIGTGTGTSGCSDEGLNSLAADLTERLGVPVSDGTGLVGSYYYLLPEGLPPRSSTLGRPLNVSPDGPGLSTALKEWLGLKLEPRKGTVQVLVVDSVQRPTEN